MVTKEICKSCANYPAAIKKCYHGGYCKHFIYAAGEDPAKLKNLYKPVESAHENAHEN